MLGDVKGGVTAMLVTQARSTHELRAPIFGRWTGLSR